MTRDKEITCAAIDYKRRNTFCHDFGNVFIDGARWADSHPHWISVKDAMPPRDEQHIDSVPVLVYNPTRKYKVYIDWYIYEDEDYIGWYSGDEGVTHWMPLPTPPEHFADVSKMISGSPEIEKGVEQ